MASSRHPDSSEGVFIEEVWASWVGGIMNVGSLGALWVGGIVNVS